MIKREFFTLHMNAKDGLQIRSNRDGALMADGFTNTSEALTTLHRMEGAAVKAAAKRNAPHAPRTVTYRHYRRTRCD